MPCNSDRFWIAAESVDICVHEFQRCDLVTQTQIWFRNARLVHETEHAKAIIDADDDNVAELGEPCARIPIKGTGS